MGDGDVEGAVGEGEGDKEVTEDTAVPQPVDDTRSDQVTAPSPAAAGEKSFLTARDRRITTPSGIPALLAEQMTNVPEAEPTAR